jgi:4-amino-4-deoxy-L-arabinose transferase-like glycosyltransferase
VTELTTQVAGKTWAESAARIGWTILIAATLYVCYFSHLGAIGFVGPDEPRYAWVARDMAETGDWVTPRLYGKPWFEKPPLFYWGAALCFKLFGVSEAAARLPSAISALLATLALAWLALRLYGAETARWLLLLLPTTVGMIGFSHAAATDMPFSGMLTIAMVAAVAAIGLIRNENTPILPRSPWLALVLFGFFLGLAVLAKGPAAIILCGGAVIFWALFTKRWRDAFRVLHPVAIATFCLTALPWYILCAHRNPDFLRVFIIEHNFKRYLTPEFQHIQPFWFYGPIVLLGCLPWTLLLLPAAIELKQSFQNRLESGATGIFLASWSLFPCIFFTFSKSKLPGYILPVIPVLALVCSRSLRRLLCQTGAVSRTILFATSVIPPILIATALRYLYRFHSFWIFDSFFYRIGYHLQLAFLTFGVAVYLAILAAPVLILLRHTRIGVFCTLPGLVAFLWMAGLTTVPPLDRALSPRVESLALANLAGKDVDVLSCGVPRSYSYGYAYYLRHEIPEWDRQRSRRRVLVVLGPGCLNEINKPNQHLQLEPIGDLLPWPVIRVEPVSADSRPRSGQPE